MSNSFFQGLATVAFLAALGIVYLLLSLKQKKTAVAVPPEFIRVAGRLFNADDISPALFDKIKEEYRFAQPAKTQYLAIVDLTSTCPLGEATRERIGLFGRNLDVVKKLADGLPKTRATMNCHECGKPSSLTSKALVWQGSFADWDGAI